MAILFRSFKTACLYRAHFTPSEKAEQPIMITTHIYFCDNKYIDLKKWPYYE